MGRSTEGMLSFFDMEFQFFSVSSSFYQSLQSAKSGFVDRTAMFALMFDSEIARLGKFSPLSHYNLHLEQYP